MTVKEIIQIENGNHNTIILLREGIFWRAYEKSAYAFSMQIHPYKPTRKWVIAVKQECRVTGLPGVGSRKCAERLQSADATGRASGACRLAHSRRGF